MIKRKTKLILAAVLVFVVAVGAYGGIKFWNYKENNPKFCVVCHLMNPAYQAYMKSSHAGMSCHECHYLSLMGQQKLVMDVVFKNPKKVEDLGDKVIVPWSFCVKCHYKTDDKYPDAPKINASAFHQQHFFAQKIECQNCHGFIVQGIVHRFKPGPTFCVKCHPDRLVHGAGMENLACLNCHTDRTQNLAPDREKCLYCHGPAEIRKQLLKNPTMDVSNYQPQSALVEGAQKITYDPKSPMQFSCNKCHDPHSAATPSQAGCIKCHAGIMNLGKHGMHIQMMKMKCMDCHAPHVWKVTPADAKKKCTKCHQYQPPENFIS
ncbi:MAG: cytochrome c3 family protein [Nitrospiraceae bacterium]|nr:cytochrome c3 family protein [Nitrospiraceae bacterium]